MPDIETEEPQIVAMTEQLAAMLGSMNLGIEGAKALVVIAYTLLILEGVTEESVAAYSKNAWDGIIAQFQLQQRIEDFINLPTATASVH